MRSRLFLFSSILLLVPVFVMPTQAQSPLDRPEPTSLITIEVPASVAHWYSMMDDLQATPFAYGIGSYEVGNDTLPFYWNCWMTKNGLIQMDVSEGFIRADMLTLTKQKNGEKPWQVEYDPQTVSTRLFFLGITAPKSYMDKRQKIDDLVDQFNGLPFVNGMMVKIYFD